MAYPAPSPSRLVTGPHKRRDAQPRECQTVQAERNLRSELNKAARHVLGATATEEEVRKLTEEWHEQPAREPPPETAFERRRRERDASRARGDIEQHLARYGDDW